jgi:hypothetical protein
MMKFLIALDMFACCIIWRDPDVTISSMCGLELRKPTPAIWALVIGGALNKINPGHCESAIIGDIARAQSALILLGGCSEFGGEANA